MVTVSAARRIEGPWGHGIKAAHLAQSLPRTITLRVFYTAVVYIIVLLLYGQIRPSIIHHAYLGAFLAYFFLRHECQVSSTNVRRDRRHGSPSQSSDRTSPARIMLVPTEPEAVRVSMLVEVESRGICTQLEN